MLFPAGEVAHWSFRSMSISDSRWNDSAARLSQMTGAPVVPVCIHGTNSFSFHASGLIHPKLRTLQLPHELLNKRGQHICDQCRATGQGRETEERRRPGNGDLDAAMEHGSALATSGSPSPHMASEDPTFRKADRERSRPKPARAGTAFPSAGSTLAAAGRV